VRRTRSFSSLLFYSLLALELLFCLAWFGLSALDKYVVFKEESSTLRQEYIEQQKAKAVEEVDKAVEYVEYQISQTEMVVREEVKTRTQEAVSIAQGLVEQMGEELPPLELQALVMNTLRTYRFNDGRGYFFATRLDGVELLFADRPEVEGKNLLGLQGGDGAYVIRDMIELVREHGEGFYEYLWTRPGADGNNHRKVAFIKYFEPFNCFIGTGEYVDQQEERLQEIALGWLVRVRFGDEGYLFGSTLQGDPLFTNGKITRGGSNVWDLTDPNGVKIIQSQVETVQSQGSGFVNYSWRKLTNAQPSPKIAYVRGVPEWGWVIGAGFYADDVDEAITALRARSLSCGTTPCERDLFSSGWCSCLCWWPFSFRAT
jgi:signal transduction histidine kinase